VLADAIITPAEARVIVMGASYKPASAGPRVPRRCARFDGLAAAGARGPADHDPLIPEIRFPGGRADVQRADPRAMDGFAKCKTCHPGVENACGQRNGRRRPMATSR